MIESKKLKIDEHGVNIIRNGETFEHIDYSHVQKAEIKREFFQKNWIVTFLIGIIIIVVSLLWLTDTLSDFEYRPAPTSLLQSVWKYIISQFLFLFFGIGIAISAFKRSLILYIWVNGKVKRIQLLDIEKQKKVDELYTFLDERIRIEKLHVL